MKKILVIHTAYIGDVILITPLLRAIKKMFPYCYLSVIVIPSTQVILSKNSYVDEILPFNKKRNKIRSFLNLLKKIRSRNFDIALLPHSSVTSALLAFLGGIKQRIGFDRWFARHFLTIRIPFREGVHRIEKNLDLLKPYTNEIFSLQTEIITSSLIQSRIDELVLKFPQKKLIAVAPGSIWFTKRWLESYYKKLIQELNKAGFFVILIGSPKEEKICRRVKPKDNYYIAAGKFNLLESAEIIKRCDLMICNDCGALHIANAVNTDVFAFFGPTTKDIGYFPFKRKDKIFEMQLSCRPCGSHGSKKCPLGHHDCMGKIKPEIVFKAIMQYFSGK